MARQAAFSGGIPRRVLVAVDADAASDGAIAAGVELERRFGAKVEFVHALRSTALGTDYVEDPRAVAMGKDLATSVTEIVRDHVRDELAAHKSQMRAEDVLRVIPGVPPRVLLERAREIDADLIVLGALRKRPIVDFGSTARAVLAKARCAVLVQSTPPATIRRILVPVDLSPESLIALSTACAWAKQSNARVHALHCFDTSSAMAGATWAGIAVAGAIDELVHLSQKDFENAMATFDWSGTEHDLTFVEGQPASRILAESKSADLIVMGTHGRTGFAAALLGSVAYSVLKLAVKPVLVVRDPQREFRD